MATLVNERFSETGQLKVNHVLVIFRFVLCTMK